MATNRCGPVFVIIRFPISRVLSCKNSLMKHMPVHKNYSGDVNGISSKVCVLEGNFPQSKGVAILSFASLREAELWKDSVPEIKQQDWMDGVDMAIVPVCHIPHPDKRFIQMLDMRFRSINQCFEEYSKEMEMELRQAGACAGVVTACADRIHKVKGLWDPFYLVINFWPCAAAFEAFYNSAKSRELRTKRCHFAETVSCVFELEPLKENWTC